MAIPEKKPYERLSDYLERSLPAELEAGKSRGKATADIIAKFNEEPPREMFAPFIWGATNASGSAGGGAGDADADAYLAAVVSAGGTTDATIEAAVQTLFTSLKSNSLYTKLDLFYPFIGGVAASNALNAIRSNSAYDITWNGSLTFSTLGVTGTGTNGDYGNTNYNPSTEATATDFAWGIYGTNANFGDNGGEKYQFGAFDSTTNLINNHRRENASSVGLYGYNVNFTRNEIAVVNTLDGQYTATFLSTGGSNTKTLYFNADTPSYPTSNTSAGTPATLVNQPYYLFTLNINGSPYSGNYWDGRLSFFWAGELGSMSGADVATMNSIITTFQTDLGRELY